MQSPKICSCFCFSYISLLMAHSMNIRCNCFICMEQLCSYVMWINQETFLCISWLLVTSNYIWIWIECLTVYWSVLKCIKIIFFVLEEGFKVLQRFYGYQKLYSDQILFLVLEQLSEKFLLYGKVSNCKIWMKFMN